MSENTKHKRLISDENTKTGFERLRLQLPWDGVDRTTKGLADQAVKDAADLFAWSQILTIIRHWPPFCGQCQLHRKNTSRTGASISVTRLSDLRKAMPKQSIHHLLWRVLCRRKRAWYGCLRVPMWSENQPNPISFRKVTNSKSVTPAQQNVRCLSNTAWESCYIYIYKEGNFVVALYDNREMVQWQSTSNWLGRRWRVHLLSRELLQNPDILMA